MHTYIETHKYYTRSGSIFSPTPPPPLPPLSSPILFAIYTPTCIPTNFFIVLSCALSLRVPPLRKIMCGSRRESRTVTSSS